MSAAAIVEARVAVEPVRLALDRTSAALLIEWSDGSTDTLTSRTLRSRCRCGECRSLMQRGEPVGAGRRIAIADVQPYGQNAVQIFFSDGHSRGIFPFAYLRELALAAQAAP